MWHDWPGLSVVPWQSCTPPNRPAPPPAPLITTGAVDTFVMVTVCDGDVVPMGTFANSNEVGERRNRRTPLPLKVKLNGWPFHEPPVLPVTGPSAVGVNA